MEEIIVEMQNASVKYKNFTLGPVNIKIPKGYIIGVTGANGAGKTTLLEMVLGCFPKMQGSITINNSDVIKEREKALSKTGIISENRTFYEDEDAIKNEEYFSLFYKEWDRKIYIEMLEKLNIPISINIGKLSKGERVKYQLAFSAAYKPSLLVLDEPVAGLDPVFKKDFFKILQEFVAEFKTTILVSDNIWENLSQVTDYAIIIENGECTWKEVF